ncbi:dienelactone hydrolase family protein [Phenylobacterium sp.]|uniref:dienelactone hydrolase family protein n=1 Tax=Phenylobacterium sp. TaxID=1871053 RepID=UPI002F4275F5
MSRQDIQIPTRDGDVRAFAFTPGQGTGPWPAVLFFMDGIGIRPALFEMAERLASHGYYVLLPDMFWRFGPYAPVDMTVGDAATRWELLGPRIATTDPEKSTVDTGAFLKFLSGQPQVKGPKVGTIGYCMGGAMSLRAAAMFPDRVAAAASFHGGNLANEADTSPHLLAPRIKAKVLVAAADKDPSFPEEQYVRLDQAFKAAGVDADMKVYEGALHGYAPPDTAAYDREASERHWREMLALFAGTLK